MMIMRRQSRSIQAILDILGMETFTPVHNSNLWQSSTGPHTPSWLKAGGTRTLSIIMADDSLEMTFEAYNDIAYLLDQLPAVDVFSDDGPPNKGPAAGSGFVFVLRDGVSLG